jgi:hypothetical protein
VVLAEEAFCKVKIPGGDEVILQKTLESLFAKVTSHSPQASAWGRSFYSSEPF